MPPYLSNQCSQISNSADLPTVCGVPILPLCGSSSVQEGPCPILKDQQNYVDIIGEAIEFFRFNALVKSRFDIRNGADKLLVYLMLWIHHCLKEISATDVLNSKTQLSEFLSGLVNGEASQATGGLGPSGFADSIAPLFSKPFTEKDKSLIKEYLQQLRGETCTRLATVLWDATAGAPSKYWVQYGRINILVWMLSFPEIVLPACIQEDETWKSFRDRLEGIAADKRLGQAPAGGSSPEDAVKKFSVTCEMCEEVPATLYCGQDKAHLCATCDQDHHSSTKLLMRHTRLPIYHSPFQFGYCKIHKADKYECVCLECGEMLCQLCLLVGAHAEANGHPIISTMEAFRLSLTLPGGDFSMINASNQLSATYFAVDRRKKELIEDLKLKHSLVVQAESNHWHIQQLLDRELRSVLETLDSLKKKRVDYLTGLRRESLLILTLLEWFEAFMVHARLSLPASQWLALFHRSRLDFTKQLLLGTVDGSHIQKVESVGDFVRLLPVWLLRRINVEGFIEIFTDFLNPNRLAAAEGKMTSSTFEWVPSPMTGVEFGATSSADAEELRKNRMAARLDELLTQPQGGENEGGSKSEKISIPFPSSLKADPVPLDNVKEFVMQTLAVLSHSEANLPELSFLMSKMPPEIPKESLGLPPPKKESAPPTIVQPSARAEEERLRQTLQGGASPYANAVSVIFNAPSSERQELIRLFAALFAGILGSGMTTTALEELIKAICRITVETIEASSFLVSGVSMFVPLTACFTLSLYPKEANFIDAELRKIVARVLPDRGSGDTSSVAESAVAQLIASMAAPSSGIVFPQAIKFLLRAVHDECMHRFSGTVAVGVTSGLFLARVVSPRLLWTAPKSGGETQAPQVITMMARYIHRIAGAAAEGNSMLQRTDDPAMAAVNTCVSQTNGLIMRGVLGNLHEELRLPDMGGNMSPRSAASKIERKLKEYGQGIVY